MFQYVIIRECILLLCTKKLYEKGLHTYGFLISQEPLLLLHLSVPIFSLLPFPLQMYISVSTTHNWKICILSCVTFDNSEYYGCFHHVCGICTLFKYNNCHLIYWWNITTMGSTGPSYCIWIYTWQRKHISEQSTKI